MEKLEHKLLPCIFCTIGLNCYVAGHNLVQASIQKMKSHLDKDFVANHEHFTMKKDSNK